MCWRFKVRSPARELSQGLKQSHRESIGVGLHCFARHRPLHPFTKTIDVQPLRVHIFGERKEGTVIPEELLVHVLVFQSGLDYVIYYRELYQVETSLSLIPWSSLKKRPLEDLILPILGSDEYTKRRATVAFPASLILRVPALVTPSVLEAYSYLEPPATILHLEGTHEVEVLAAMRQGDAPWMDVRLPETDLTTAPADTRIVDCWIGISSPEWIHRMARMTGMAMSPMWQRTMPRCCAGLSFARLFLLSVDIPAKLYHGYRLLMHSGSTNHAGEQRRYRTSRR